MPHISKKQLKKEVASKINKTLVQIIAGFKSKKELETFLEEFLTETEKVMLAKRLYAVLMLEKGYSFNKITRTLNISQSTTVRFWRELKNEGFSVLKKKVKKEKDNKKFWSELESLLRFGMPPYGKGRWRNIYRITDKKN